MSKKKRPIPQKKTPADETKVAAVERTNEQTGSGPKSKLWRWVGLTGFIVIATAAGLFLADYLQRAPVREAQQKIAERDYGFAMTVLTEYLEDHPYDLVAMSLKARAHAGLNEFEQCKQIYEQIEGVFAYEDQYAFAKSLTMLSKYNEAHSNWIGVMAHINQGELDRLSVEEKNAQLGEALYLMAVCQSQLGRVEQAVQTTNDLLGVEGFELQGRYLLGLIEAKRGNETIAIEQWDRVLELDPEVKALKIPPHLFFYEAGALKVEQGLSEAGIKLLEESLRRNYFVNNQPMDPTVAKQAMEAIGSAYDDLGNAEQSKLFWNKLTEFEAMTGQKPSLLAREGLANLALQENRPQDAIRLLVQLRVAGVPEKSSTTYLMQRALAMLGKEKEALEFKELTRQLREKERKINTVRAAIRSQSGTFWSVVLRAYDFANDGNWGQAQQLLESVKENLTDDYSKRLYDAVQNKSALPPLTEIPVEIF